MWVSFSHHIMSTFTCMVQHHHRQHHHRHHHQLHPVGHTNQQQVPAQHVPHQPHYLRCDSCGLHDSHKTWNERGMQHRNCNELSSKAFLIHIKLMWSVSNCAYATSAGSGTECRTCVDWVQEDLVRVLTARSLLGNQHTKHVDQMPQRLVVTPSI